MIRQLVERHHNNGRCEMLFTHAEIVPGRGTVVYEIAKVVVFSRKDSNGSRVFDVVDYYNVKAPNGYHLTTFYDVKQAKKYAEEFSRIE